MTPTEQIQLTLKTVEDLTQSLRHHTKQPAPTLNDYRSAWHYADLLSTEIDALKIQLNHWASEE